MLWLGLMTRDTGIPASQHLGIRGDAAAMSFDLAVTHRLLKYDNEKEAASRKFWIALLGGKADDTDDTHGDSYADENTEYW